MSCLDPYHFSKIFQLDYRITLGKFNEPADDVYSYIFYRFGSSFNGFAMFDICKRNNRNRPRKPVITGVWNFLGRKAFYPVFWLFVRPLERKAI